MAHPRQIALDDLVDRFPEWTIRASGIGRWWAIREGTHLPPGCRVTLQADTLDDLAALLAYQERLRSPSPGALLTFDTSREIPFRTGDPT